jgi:NADH:ubiquinone oxidoreductase subunit H
MWFTTLGYAYYNASVGVGHRIISLMSIPLFTIGTLVINIIYFVLLDRLMMAAVQRRTGPYNVGYFGLLQSMDDGLKLVKSEVIIPKKSSCILFLVVPNLFFYCSLIL